MFCQATKELHTKLWELGPHLKERSQNRPDLKQTFKTFRILKGVKASNLAEFGSTRGAKGGEACIYKGATVCRDLRLASLRIGLGRFEDDYRSSDEAVFTVVPSSLDRPRRSRKGSPVDRCDRLIIAQARDADSIATLRYRGGQSSRIAPKGRPTLHVRCSQRSPLQHRISSSSYLTENLGHDVFPLRQCAVCIRHVRWPRGEGIFSGPSTATCGADALRFAYLPMGFDPGVLIFWTFGDIKETTALSAY